jgi:hypothetical protein
MRPDPVSRGRAAGAAALAVAALAGLPAAAAVQDFEKSELPISTQSVRLTGITVELQDSTGDPARDAALRRAVEAVLPLAPGSVFDRLLADGATLQARRVEGVRNAVWRLESTVNPDGAMLIVSVSLARDAPPASGLLQTGSGYPTLYRNDRQVLTLTVNGGSGFFTDLNPWFRQPLAFTRGNPLVQEPALGAQTGSSASWTEQYIEYGINGMTQLGDSPAYLYGALTGLTAVSIGRDIFRDDTRSTTRIEKAYLGLLLADPQGRYSGTVSFGRQNFTLNDGFLVAQYGSQYNAGPRPGIYLAPRTTHDRSVLAQLRAGPWLGTFFRLDPNEFEPLESNTVVAGGNLRYTFTPSTYVDASVIQVPRSGTRYARPGLPAGTRDGLEVLAVHGRWADRAVLPGVWLESEVARQTNANFPMEAWGWYGTVGYLAAARRWKPSISYRYASLDGDDPNTETYERYDGLFSGGLNEWLQGITINKALTNANRNTHRVRLNVNPQPALNLTFDVFIHRAEDLNNVGGNPALGQLKSRDLGTELQFVTRWALSRQLYFVGVVSHAMPGDAIEQAVETGKVKPWTTLQAQFYWNF